MLEVVSAVLLTAHLILIDVAMIGPLASVWFDWRGTRRSQPEISELGRRLAAWSLGSLVVGGLLGAVLLAMRYLDDERYFRALSAIPRDRLWFAGAEFVFSLLALSLYVGLWRRWRKGRLGHALLAVAASSNLMMHFPALFAVISIVSTRAAWAGRTLDRAEFRGLLVDGEVLSRVVHVWLAAVAVTGVAVAWLALRTMAGEGDLRARIVRTGARLALTGTMLQFPVGLWVALAMPESARAPLLGGDAAATLFFLASVTLAMVLMHVLSGLALSEPTARQAWRASAVLVGLMLLMVGTRVRLDRNLLTPRPAPAPGERTGRHEPQALASPESSDSIGGSTSAMIFATRSFR